MNTSSSICGVALALTLEACEVQEVPDQEAYPGCDVTLTSAVTETFACSAQASVDEKGPVTFLVQLPLNLLLEGEMLFTAFASLDGTSLEPGVYDANTVSSGAGASVWSELDGSIEARLEADPETPATGTIDVQVVF